LAEKPEWYVKTNPLTKVPSIEHDGKLIYESLVITDYVDDVFKSGKKILPEDAYEKAKQRMLIERLSALSSALYPWYRNSQDPAVVEKLENAYKLYEQLLHHDFFSGNQVGYVDYMIWPWIERLGSVDILSKGQLAVTHEKYPKFAAYIDRMKAVPEIQAFLLDVATHVKFLQSRMEGKPNYDLL